MIITYLINASKKAFSSDQSKKEEAKNDEKKPPPPCSHRTIAAAPDETYEPAGPCLECKAEKRAASNYRTRIILGLILPYALQALDVTM